MIDHMYINAIYTVSNLGLMHQMSETGQIHSGFQHKIIGFKKVWFSDTCLISMCLKSGHLYPHFPYFPPFVYDNQTQRNSDF